MSIPILYLNPAEENTLRAFAEGKSGGAICAMGLVPLVGIWIFAAEIRRKTGIYSTGDTKECKKYIERYEAAMANPVPLSEDQQEILRLLRHDNTFEAIEYRVKKPVRPLLEEACEQMGIFTKDEPARRLQFKLYWAAFHAEQLDTWSETMLRKWANGMSYEQLAEEMNILPQKVKQFVRIRVHALRLITRGRNTQRNLVHSYFRFMDWKNARETPVTMDDPAF